ncbi:DUF2946 family protein [Croceicoccus sp. Ery5]|uniref:DUF2946 family protein n=1 Tax=Croceicoccus sp. Ery5 TaxID=1703340 RepID=UPI001E4EAB27|nr:DUF2946 family protein [Croceicoccus sp. Ery5]
MDRLRHLIRQHRRMALVLLALALLIRAAVPSGFMLSAQSGGSITVVLCTSTGPVAMVRSIPQLHHDQQGHHGDTQTDQGAKPLHCAFSGLSHAALTGGDIALLAAAIAFIMLLAVHAAPLPTIRRPAFLRPPLRAPPLSA